jgi:hypothetical protein
VTSALVRALASGDTGSVADAVRHLRELAGHAGRLRYAAGLGGLLLHDLTGDAHALDQAIADLEDARAAQPAGSGGELLRSLHQAYRQRGAGPEDLQAATDAGLAALVEDIGTVVLRTGGGLRPALDVGAFAHELALDCLAQENPEAAMTALELGRGLVLHAATTTADLPELLDTAGFPELAAQWRAAPPPGPPAATAPGATGPDALAALLRALGPDGAEAVSDLRLRTLDALADTAVGRILFSTCDADTVATALRAAGRDALVYLLSGDADRRGWALIVTAGSGLRSVELPGLRLGIGDPLDAWVAGAGPTDPTAFDELCRWAGLCVVGPVLARLPTGDPRVTLVPCGPLATVPWHAATLRPGSGPHACELATLSRAATGRQFVDLTHRPRLPLSTRPISLPNPDPEDLLRSLRGCPGPLGLVILSASDEGRTIANAFIAAGATGVIASLWPVADQRTSLLMHVLHDGLERDDPPDLALQAAQRWMLDPHRALPDGLPAALTEVARSTDLSDPTVWAAFIHHG